MSAASTVVGALEAAGLDVEEVAPDAWMTVLSGERKRTLPVLLAVADRTLHLQALLCGAPDENHAAVFRYLLQRNQRRSPVHFAVDDDGDVLLVGSLPLDALDETTFDRLLGELLTTADETFNAVLRLGFATYIDAEQRWRARNGMPANPVAPPADRPADGAEPT